LQWKGLALMYETMFSPVSWFPILSPFYSFSQQSRISEECSKYLNEQNNKPWLLSVSSWLMTPETVGVCKVLLAGMIFIMQNHFWSGKIFCTEWIKSTKKNNKK
jgi:hypothetical protein